MMVPKVSCNFDHICATNVLPWAEVAWSGIPNLLTQWAMKAPEQEFAVASANEIASTNLVVLSRTVRRYLMPLDSGNEPHTSIIRSENLFGRTGLWARGGLMVLWVFTS